VSHPSSVEPWLRGTHAEVPAVGRAVLHALDLALEDLNAWTNGLSDAEGGQLSVDQLALLKAEQNQPLHPEAEPLPALLTEVEGALRAAADRVRGLSMTDLDIPRGVGRKQLPTSIGGALVHVADHTQRHVGQVITTAKVLKGLRG